MNIGEKIKNLRCDLNLTQEELATAANTTKQTIHKYETGIISNIPASKIKAIADRLNTTPAYLMGWEEPEPPTTETTVTAEDLAEINELYEIYSSLPEEQQQIVTDLIRSLSKNHSDNNTTDNK